MSEHGATLEGVVERIVYESAENGFFVARLRAPGHPELVTIVGNLMAISPGETIRVTGQWVEDPRWGRQIRVDSYDVLVPDTVVGIEKYLGSGMIAGIGPEYAKRLVAAFGADTLRVIDEEPRKLRNVPGIGKVRLTRILEAWKTQKGIRAIMLFLQGHGIGAAQAGKIFKRYGDTAVAVLRDNPYRLAGEISGIGFKTADKIAGRLGLPRESPQRLQAGLVFALDKGAGEGHVFLPRGELLATAAELLEVAEGLLEGPLAALTAQMAVAIDADAVYLPRLYEAEKNCARELHRILKAPAARVSIHVENAIRWVEQTQQIALSEGQRQAIQIAAESKLMVITGGPGTGKTTLIRGLLGIFEKKGLNPLLAAPTGRAAKRMEAATGHEASTIHRLLEFSPKHGQFLRNRENPLDADLVIIDETSMIDVFLMQSLLQAIPDDARVFFVGDVDQLPSVGPGMVLMDVIASERVPVVWLNTVFRQAEENGIVANAHRINQGEFPQSNTRDFVFVQRKEPKEALDTVVELLATRIPRRFGFDPVKDIQVLAPMHRGDIGVARLNEAIQQALNPNGTPLGKKEFRAGDKVMQLRNNYELDVYNGDIGYILGADAESGAIRVQYDDRVVLYEADDIDDLTAAYAVTVHKSQGSEYPAVVIPLVTQHYLLLQRNVLYTAVTRGKRLVVIVGDPRAITIAIKNNRVAQRHTRLVERIRGG